MSEMNGHKEIENLSLVLHDKNDLRLEQTPIPKELQPNDCLLQTECCGICGSDIHLWAEGCLADFVVSSPYVIGHESSATVIAVGENVDQLKPGDRVSIEPAIPCQKCNYCRQGRYNLCPISNKQSRGLPPMDGCLRRYYTHPADFCHKLPESVSFEEGAMCEPFSVIVHAARRVQVTAGQNILVCGAGTMGIMSVLCAKAFGANKVYVTDVSKNKLEMAKRLGADKTFLIEPKTFDDMKMANQIVEEMGENPDITFECTGVDMSTSMAIYATKNGGKVAIIGLGHKKSRIPIAHAAMREIDLIGICRFKDDFPLAIQLIASGKVSLKSLVTHRFPIEEGVDAFRLMKSGNEGVLKVMISY